MNWVGGSRTRVIIKQEKRKQKEYFEKKRLKSKMKLLGISSPVKKSAVSLDLLNLYVVNQISCQKKKPETVRKPIHVNMKRDIKIPLRKHNLELPMSPLCVPSKLCIDDIENNIHYQRLGSKEEPGPVQSSQVMDSYRIFEPQFNRIENCGFTPPSFSAEFSSDRHHIKQNFITRIAPSPQKAAYEKQQNDQLSNVNYSNSLVSKLNESQNALSPSYKTAEFETLLGRLNSPGNTNFLTGRPAVFMGEDCASMDKRRHSDFITEKQSVQDIWEENRKEVSNFLEDINQPPQSLLPGNFDSFFNENVINLLSIDQERTKKPFDKCGYKSMRDICAVTSSFINYSSDGCIRSIFTDPELNFSSSNFNKTSYPEKCQPNNSYQREYNNNEKNNPSIFFEDCDPASSEEKGKFERDCLEKTSQIEIQKYPVNNIINNSSEELHSKKSWNAGLGKVLLVLTQPRAGLPTCPPTLASGVAAGAPSTVRRSFRPASVGKSDSFRSSSLGGPVRLHIRLPLPSSESLPFRAPVFPPHLGSQAGRSCPTTFMCPFRPRWTRWSSCRPARPLPPPDGTTYSHLDSSHCSQSSSYSPRPTDSYFSSSSEMPSEDEDQPLQQIEDSSQRATKNKETTNNSLERMAEFPHDRIIDNNAKIHKQNENFHQFSIKNNTDQFAESQSNSAHMLQNKASDSCIVQFVSCDAWVQTESEPVRNEKFDAAIQCDIILECKCRRDVLPLCNVEMCGENINADTTGGQEILKNN
ncbi:regulator of DNA class I crossover intermediates 1 [Rhynchonycteris naso]